MRALSPTWRVLSCWAIATLWAAGLFRELRHIPDGRLGEVRRPADIPVGIAVGRGKFASSALESDIPAPCRAGASEAPGGRSDLPCDVLTSRRRGVGLSLKLNCLGHYVLSVVSSGQGRSQRVDGPPASVPRTVQIWPMAARAYLAGGRSLPI